MYPEQTSTLACTSASANVTIGINGDVLSIYNLGPNDAFLAFAFSGATATAVVGTLVTASNDGGMPIKNGERLWLRADPTLTNVGGICIAAQTATLRITRGSGQH